MASAHVAPCRSEARLRFLLDLVDRLAAIDDPARVGAAAAEALAGHLGVAQGRFEATDAPGDAPAAGGSEGARLAVPLPDKGRSAGWLVLTDPAPRDFDASELALAEDVAARTASAIARVRADAAVRAGARQLQQIADTLPVLISFLDADRRYRFVSKTYEDWFGRPRSEIEGQLLVDVIGADAYAAVAPRLDRVFAGETVSFEQFMPYAGAQPRHVHVEYVPRHDGQGRVDGVYALVQDITAASRSEAAVRESEARFRGVFNSDLMGLTIFDSITGETLAINDFFLRMTGHDRADFEEGRWDWRDFTLPEYLHLDEIAIAQARERGWWDPYEKEYRRRDGSRFPIRISSAPMPGEPGRVIVSIQDISATRAAQAELRESEQRLQLAKQAAGVGVWDWDLRRDEISWSPEMYELLGIDPATPADRLYAEWAARLDPVDRAIYEPLVQRAARRGEAIAFDFRIRDASGATRWIRSQALAVAGPDGTPLRLTGVNLDVTAQHREEERLREAAQSLAAEVAERTRERDRIWNLSHDLMCVGRLDGTLLSLNPAWERVLGWDAAHLLATQNREIRHPDERARTVAEMERLRRGEAVENFEIRFRHADGSWRWFSWTIVPEGELYYGIGRDVTAERQAAIELERAQDALRQAQKMEAVGQLTGGIAHDFNNLLGAVVGGFELISRKPGDPERVRRIAENGLAAAERGAKLTGQLLAFSRAQKLDLRPIVARDVVAGMHDLLRTTLGPTVDLAVDLDGPLVAVLCDAVQLEMAVLNLAINARDAMPAGGALRIATRTCALDHDPELASGEYVEIAVSDAGIGMAPDVLERAFDPFFTTKGVGKGTGLGLSQVYGIARQSGGGVRIESAVGRGTTVRILLPRTDAPAARTIAAAAEAGIAAPARHSVLLVDDDPDVRRMLADALESLGYRVTQAEDGEAGLARLDAARPDLVIVDFAMPGMSGAEVAAAIRARRPELPIVFASGYSDTAAIERALGPNAPLLRKPFRLDELQAALRTALLGTHAPRAANG